MSIKDSINKSFTIGDVTTMKYDDEAKVKVKDFYVLDKMNRKKLLELADLTDGELAKRDVKIEELENEIENIDAGGGGNAGSTGDGMITYYPPQENKYYILYKKLITKSEMEEKFNLSLEKYNNLNTVEKFRVDHSLQDMGVEFPVTIEKIRTFINGKPTGCGGKNLMYICNLFADCIELKTDLNVEFFKTEYKNLYISDGVDYYKLLLPKLTIYINDNKELVFSEREAFGIWNRTEGIRKPAYNSLGCPIMIRHDFMENGDCEVRIILNAGYDSHYVLKTNVMVEKVELKDYFGKPLKPLIEFDYNSISYISGQSIPINLNYYLSGIDKDKIRSIYIINTAGTQVSKVRIELMVKEAITITATPYTEKRVELFKNLNLSSIYGNKEIILSGGTTENIKAILTYSSLIIVVPKNESIELKPNTTYQYIEKFVNDLY